MSIAAIVNLLPILCGEYQELVLIRELTEYFHFDHHFYLLDSSADTDRYINTTGSTPRSLYDFRSEENFTESDSVEQLNSKNAFMIVVPESSQLVDHFDLLWRFIQTHRIPFGMKIGVFFSRYSAEGLRRFFERCKENLIINIFAATYQCSEDVDSSRPECPINIFTFDPFGELDVINVTSSETYDGFFRSLNSNFHQHQLQLGTSIGNLRHRKLWRIVLRMMNASFVELKDSSLNYIEALMNGVDIIPDLIAQFYFHVYPIETTYHGIIVPEALPYSEFSAYLRNATSGELIGYSFITMIAVILVLSILRYIKQKKISILQSVADVCNLLMNDNGHIRYQQLCRSEVFIIVPLTFVGLIVTNGILSILQSHLTRPLLQPQIKTIEDIYASPFPVLIFSEEDGSNRTMWKTKVIDELSNRSESKDWSKKMLVEEQYYEYLGLYNHTSAFLVNLDLAKVVLGLQKRLQIRGYHNPDIGISQFLFGYCVNYKFLFFERLDDIIHRMHGAGLYDLWHRQDDFAIEKGIIKMNEGRWLNHEEMRGESFEFPMFIVYGWLAGLIVFILEIIWKRLYGSRLRKTLRTMVGKFGH